MMDEDLKQAVTLLRRHAVRHNLPPPVLTVSADWMTHQKASVGIDTYHDRPRSDKTMINGIAIEVDHKRRWSKP